MGSVFLLLCRHLQVVLLIVFKRFNENYQTIPELTELMDMFVVESVFGVKYVGILCINFVLELIFSLYFTSPLKNLAFINSMP